MKKAIVTIASGEKHYNLWRSHSKQNWEKFCETHNYNLQVFDKPLDNSPIASTRSIAWQKLICHLHPALSNADSITWLDCDIVINPNSPDPRQGQKEEDFLSCQEFDWGNDPQTTHLKEGWLKRQASDYTKAYKGKKFEGFYETWGFGEGSGPLINSGFFSFTPQHHGELLRHVYTKYNDDKVELWGEMVPLSETINKRGVLKLLDQRFNFLVYPFIVGAGYNINFKNQTISKSEIIAAASLIAKAFNSSYFLHFAGCKDIGMRIMSSFYESENGEFRPDFKKCWPIMKRKLLLMGHDINEDC